MSAHPETPRFRGIVGRWVGMGQRENFLMETIPIPIFICSEMSAVRGVCFSKLEKFHSLDTTPVCWLLGPYRHFIQYNPLSCPLLVLLTVKDFTVTVV